MKQEEKQLLIKYLCTRLPYGIKIEVCVKDKNIKSVDCVKYDTVGTYIRLMDDENFSIKPFLRPMSSMTEEEEREFCNFEFTKTIKGFLYIISNYEQIDWLNAYHFDYIGLIEKGLALEAPEGMYEIVPTSI